MIASVSRSGSFARLSLPALLVLACAAPSAASSHTRPASAVPPADTYTPYAVTDGTKTLSGGEPSVGVDLRSNSVLYGAGTHVTRMVFDDRTSPATVAQTNVTPPTAVTTLDGITFVDQHTGRVFDSQLLGACSLMSYSDDAGATWTPTSGCGAGTVEDHQSVGGGPFHAPLTGGVDPAYSDAVYYCAQNGFNASCASSLDGGLTFGAGSYISNTPANSVGDPFGGACSGLHGHLKVGPDGTVYVPIKGCGGTPTAGNLTNQEFYGGSPAVSVSSDNGLTYTVHTVPGGHNADESDNSVAVDKGNRLYMAWQDAAYPNPADPNILPITGLPKVAYSDDQGKTWSAPLNLAEGLPAGSRPINNIQFPSMVAGDAGRAAVAFIGTDAIGDDQHNGFNGPDGKPAVWHLYVSTTLNGGRTWTTVDTTPNDPVQRGCVDLQGTSNKTVTDTNICSQRNLLDFNDVSVDKQGRVVAAFADGCVGACVTNPNTISTAAVDTVMRQTTGTGLFKDGLGSSQSKTETAARKSPSRGGRRPSGSRRTNRRTAR